MGTSISIPKVNYEDIQYGIENNSIYLIHTFQINNDQCLISKSVNSSQEEMIINQLLKNTDKSANIIIYGKNSSDETIVKKYNQLVQLGFKNVYIYPGGMFEWLLLQDVYGTELFSTTCQQQDILKYKPNKSLYVNYLTNSL